MQLSIRHDTAMSNDFGVLSLSVGDAKTFDDMDWSKLPLYIEVSIDGVLITKSQVLSVPVAEYAKKSGFVLTKEFLASKTWNGELYGDSYQLQFSTNGTFNFDGTNVGTGNFYISGNNVFLDGEMAVGLIYIPERNQLFCESFFLHAQSPNQLRRMR